MQDCCSNLSAVVKIAEPFQQNFSKSRVMTGINQIIQGLLIDWALHLIWMVNHRTNNSAIFLVFAYFAGIYNIYFTHKRYRQKRINIYFACQTKFVCFCTLFLCYAIWSADYRNWSCITAVTQIIYWPGSTVLN